LPHLVRFACHQHQFLTAFNLNLVAHPESAAVVDHEVCVSARVGIGAVIDRVLIGQKLIFEPFMMSARSFAHRIAQRIKQRRLKRRDYTDQIRYVLGQFR